MRTFNLILTIIIILLVGFCAALYVDNIRTHKLAEKNRLRAESYARAKGQERGYAKIKEYPSLYKNIELEIGTPCYLLQAIKAHENASELIDFGVKTIPTAVLKLDPEEWQPRAAAKIVNEEAFKLILSDKKIAEKYFMQLVDRYCYRDRDNWARNVRSVFQELSK